MAAKSILLAHPWMGRGGSEATASWVAQALQDDYEVTFATSSPLIWDDLNSVYGTEVDPGKIRYLKAPSLPPVNDANSLVHLHRRHFERFCRRIALQFDLCISAYNPISFGKPSIQLLGDFSFSEEMRKRLYIHGATKFCHRDSLLRKSYLGLSNLIAVSSKPLGQRGDLVLANSQWCADQLNEFFDVPDAPVIYPPVVLPKAPAESERDPLGFVCLGRIVPEKEIERLISILLRIREKGFPVTLKLIGALDDSEYSKSVASLIDPLSDWVEPEGYLTLDRKHAVLASQTYAIHTCRIEAFGIAVAEMASMGCVPFVPSTGGAGEIVPMPGLQFETDDEAVSKIVAFLNDPAKAARVRERLPEQMNRFGPEVFMRELKEHVLAFLDSSLSSATDAASRENIAATY